MNLEYILQAHGLGSSDKADDKTGSPGPKELIGGDMQAGYFGVVPASALFTGAEISSACGISAGTLQFNDSGWLKFAIDGKIVFKSQKPFKHTISWDDINAAGCVTGNKKVSKNGHTYKVRLLKGGNGNVNDSLNGPKKSEWNRLMLPIHIKAKDQSWAHSQFVQVPTPYWGIAFTDADLQTHRNHGNGSYQWCQEDYNSATSRVVRGFTGVSNSYYSSSSTALDFFGWSPILEYVQ